MSTLVSTTRLSKILDSIAAALKRKLDANGVRNDATTTDAGYVLDARMGKTLGDRAEKLEIKVGDLYFDTDSSGRWGYKSSKNGAVTPFRNPTGSAAAADVLSGKTFSSATAENVSGSMPNNGAWTGKTTGKGNVTIPAGYHSGQGYVSGEGAYNSGMSDADARVNEESASYKSGYTNGNNNGGLAFNRDYTIALTGGSIDGTDTSNGGKGISIGITVKFNPYTGKVSCSGGASAGARCFNCGNGEQTFWSWSQNASARVE